MPLVLDHRPLFDRYVINLIADGDPGRDAITEQRFRDHSHWAEHDRRLFEEKPLVRDDLPRFLGTVIQFEANDRHEVRL